jgi:hypothetical protein
MAAGEKHRRGKMALRVLQSLPSQHEKFFYREIRKLCMDFVISLGLPLTDRSSAAGELLSMAKLVHPMKQALGGLVRAGSSH